MAVGVAETESRPTYRGVQLHSLWSDSTYADMDRELDLVRESGSNVVRLDVVWGSLEIDGKGRYSEDYVEKLDRFMRGANTRGIKVLVVLWSSPCWASSAPDDLKQGCTGAWWAREVGNYPPRDARDYADTARWLTGRYGTKLAALEVWNEPNLTQPGNSWQAANKAAAYAGLLKAAYPAAKAGDPSVPVLAGALSFADRPFLDALYREGIQGFYDGISIHPYNEWRDPSDRWQSQWKQYTFLPGLEWIREGQLLAGDSKPIWITEFGWTTAQQSSERWGVTEPQQADYVRNAFAILDGRDYVEAAVVYNLRDKGTDPSDFESNFGLVNRDYTPKPAFWAMQAALRAGIPSPSSADSEPLPRPRP